MKKSFLMFILIFFVCTLAAEKVYRRDGSFYELKRNPGVFASIVPPRLAKSPENYALKINYGDQFVVIRKDGTGELPVYLTGIHPFIATEYIFYGGDKSADVISKKYDAQLVEVLPTYKLSKFRVKGDSVKIAQQIVENGDGFAFPNIIRRMEWKANPVKFPVGDKYYKEGYQWSLKNPGEGIDPYGTKIDTLENADIRFEQAIEWIYNQIEAEAEELADFAEMKVAIMDSGVDNTHPDLKNKMDKGWNMVNKEEGGYPGEIEEGGMYGTSGYSHGTNCAGVSAAQGNEIGTVGICPWCGIYPVTYMEGGMGGGVDEAQLLVVYQKYVDDPTIVAINCSFGPMAGMGDVPVTSAETESHENFLKNGRGGLGGAILYASGNDGTDASYYKLLDKEFTFERNGENVTAKPLSVGASSAWDTRVAYSNYSETLDIIAPSLSMNPLLGIATSYLVGYGDLDEDYTNQFSGTSSACPVVTGFFGTVFSVNPNLTLEEATEILYQSADKINPETGFWDANGHSVKFGYGRVNLLKAVRLAAGLDMCETTTDEIDNNIDDNCDGYVDEGFGKDLTKVGKQCSADADCTNDDFAEGDVECLTGEYKAYNFKSGYCTIKNDNFACPDGTAQYSDAQTDVNCFLECNVENSCPDGFRCSDDVLGLCFPACESDEDCAEGSYCNDDKECKQNPSEPGGECESDEGCLYDAMCITQIPGGFCMKMCSSDAQCGDNGAQCVKVEFGGQGAYDICLPSCESDSDCRSFGGMMTMKCHEYYDGNENVCSMPCQADGDCQDPDAECKDSVCVKAGSETSDDEVSDEETDGEVSDEETTETEEIPDTKTDKKSDGCSLIVL